MQPDELMALVSKTAALMEQFERRCEVLEHRLEDLTQQLPATFRQSSQGLLQTLPDQLASQVHQHLDRPLIDYQHQVRTAQDELGHGTHIVATQIRRLEALHRHLVWKVLGVTFGCLVLLLAGGIWLSTHYAKVIQENQLNAELLKRYNAADVVLCGEQLCANIDLKAPRVGDHKQYLPIKAH